MLAGDNDQLVGMITDRDTVIRSVANGKEGAAQIREVMSAKVEYCFEDDEVSEVAQYTNDMQVRRPPMLNWDKRLVGIDSTAHFF